MTTSTQPNDNIPSIETPSNAPTVVGGEPNDTVPAAPIGNGKRFRSHSKDLGEKQIDSSDKFAGAIEAGIKPAFLAKCELINEAIKEIGMGRYQIELFFTAGESKSGQCERTWLKV